jgi:hypothetical protein
MKKLQTIATTAAILAASIAVQAQTIQVWETEADRSQLFSQEENSVEFTVNKRERVPYIVVDPARS